MNNIERYKKDIDRLIKEGEFLYTCLLYENTEDEKFKKEIREKIEKPLPKFSERYQSWYSEALECLQQLLPSRVEDFISYYKPMSPNRKKESITYESYTITDCLNGLYIKNSIGEKIVGPDAAIPKFFQQLKIIESIQKKFESLLFDIRTILQADLFDNEIDAADELKKKGFLRAAGVLAGVVLESHLKEVCIKHMISIKKSKPTITDFNDALKTAKIIDIPTWRNIQFLADIRNLCGHNKGRDPKESEVEDLIAGTRKITKTIF
jgi:hypothetical protein